MFIDREENSELKEVLTPYIQDFSEKQKEDLNLKFEDIEELFEFFKEEVQKDDLPKDFKAQMFIASYKLIRDNIEFNAAKLFTYVIENYSKLKNSSSDLDTIGLDPEVLIIDVLVENFKEDK